MSSDSQAHHNDRVKITIDCTVDKRAYLRKDFPNKDTLEAMKEIDEGGGIHCDSIEDFWKKMGINRSV